MKILSKRTLPLTLAGALVITNLGAIMPMTAYAADDETTTSTSTSTATYTGQSFDVTVSWDTAVTSMTYPNIKLSADAAVTYDSQNYAAGADVTIATDSILSEDGKSITVSGLTASTAGTITFTAVGVGSDTTTELGSTTVTITAAAIESLDDIDGTVKYIPNATISDENVTTSSNLALSVTENFNYYSAAKDLTWVVLDSNGENADSYFSFTDPNTISTLTDENTTYTETITIAANSESEPKAGTYTVKVYPTGYADTYKTYDFTVAEISSYSLIDDDDASSATLAIGDTSQLTFYYDNKKVSSGVTWSVPDGTTAVTVSDAGLVTAVSATTESVKVTATYALNDDMTIKDTYAVTVSADSYTVDVDDYTLEIGDTTTATLMFGKTAVTSGITWTSSDTSVATIDSSGNITAVAAGTAEFTVKYKTDSGTYTTITTEELTVNKLSYVYTDADGDVVTTANVVIGETYQLYVSRSDGKDITGTVTWKSGDKNVATVNSSGLVTVDSEAEANATATITAYIDGEKAVNSADNSVTITAVEAVYTAKVVKSDGTSTTIAASDETANLYYGETLNLTALYNGSEVDGEWKIGSTKTGNIKVTTAGVVSVIKTVLETDTGTIVEFYPEDSEVEAISLKVYVYADAISLYQDGKAVAVVLDDTSTSTDKEYKYKVASMEQDETATFTVKLGSTDITSDAVWEPSDKDIVSVSDDGVVTAVAEGIGATATATYTVISSTGSVTYTVTITVAKVIGSTGAIEASETAETEAATATEKATEATEAAETAQTAAAVAKANPTDANLKAATDALAEANSALSAAQSALETAQAALAEAEAAGAKSEGAQAAVEAATEAVEAAEANVAAAEEAVETATAAVKEASTAVDEKKAADAAAEQKAAEEKAAAEKAAAEKAAAQATGATGTDSASGNAYKVTDGSSKTVAITKASSNASGKVTIPSTVTISGDKFTVTEISANAFKGNKKIKQVVIPKTVTKIGKNAFKNCSKVTKITIKATKNLTVGKNAFKGLKDGSKIVVKGVSGSAKKKLVKKIKKQVTSSRTTVK